jgi:hypothetical protein
MCPCIMYIIRRKCADIRWVAYHSVFVGIAWGPPVKEIGAEENRRLRRR